MSRVLAASEICARSLRAIGAFPVTESSADGEQLREAMHWLDLILAETVGTDRIFSRVYPTTLPLTITNGTQSYNLFNSLGTALPPDKLLYITGAWIEDAAGNRYEVEVVGRETFEDVPDLAETGKPCRLTVDRTENPTLRIFPTPASTDSETWTLKLVGQQYAPNVAPGGVTGTIPSGSALHQFGQAWQRWMVLQLAHDLGSGPIFKIAETSLTRFQKQADDARGRLDGFENAEHETGAPVCEPWGM